MNIIPFQYHDSKIRVIEQNGEPWFVAKDVAEVLGYSKSRNAIAQHCKGALKQGLPSTSGIQETTIIPERDVYRLIMRSKLPAAEKFEEWVVGEVLPSIRKTGGYNHSPQAQTGLPETQAAESIASTLKIGQLLGTEPEMARVIAVKRAREITGYDATPLLGQQQAIKENPETPTQLGKRIGLSPIDMNLELESNGLQTKNGKQWMPTGEGRKFCTMNPYQSKHSEHTGYRVLWRPSVLSHLGYQAVA